LLPLIAHLLDSFGALDKLEAFVSKNGRAFYKKEINANSAAVRLRRGKTPVTERYSLMGQEVVPFWSNRDLAWEIIDN
jgi:dihydroorotase